MWAVSVMHGAMGLDPETGRAYNIQGITSTVLCPPCADLTIKKMQGFLTMAAANHDKKMKAEREKPAEPLEPSGPSGPLSPEPPRESDALKGPEPTQAELPGLETEEPRPVGITPRKGLLLEVADIEREEDFE